MCRRKTKEQFIIDGISKHGDKYKYEMVEYKNSNTKVEILCPEHGVFEQTPKDHLDGKGCKYCYYDRISKTSGWTKTKWEEQAKNSKNFDSFKVYIIRCWNENEEFYKIGRTFRSISERFESKIKMPYEYELLESFEGTAEEMYNLENNIQKHNNKNKYKPELKFKGDRECFGTIEK